jgi:hypothetical protein
VSRGATNLVGPTAGLSGIPTRQGTGPDQLQRTDRENYQARRGKLPTSTHRRNSRQRQPGVAEAAGVCGWDPRSMSYAPFVLRVSQSPQWRFRGLFSWAAVFRPVGSGTARHDNLAAPDCGTVSRGATKLVGPTADLFVLPTRQGFGPDQLPRNDREK